MIGAGGAVIYLDIGRQQAGNPASLPPGRK